MSNLAVVRTNSVQPGVLHHGVWLVRLLAHAVGYRRGRVIVLSVCGLLSRAWKTRENPQERDGVDALTSARLPLTHNASARCEMIS
jgi:hypothetical protein